MENSNNGSVEIWDTVLTAKPDAALDWQKLSRIMVQPVQITEDMFSEACDLLNSEETDFLTDDGGRLFAVGMHEKQFALYRVEALVFVELVQFNAAGKFCSHRNLALRGDEMIDDFKRENEHLVREISRAQYEAATWYAESSHLAQKILDLEK